MKTKIILLMLAVLFYLGYFFNELQNKTFSLIYLLLFLIVGVIHIYKKTALFYKSVIAVNLVFIGVIIYEKAVYSTISSEGIVWFLPLLIISAPAFKKTKISS